MDIGGIIRQLRKANDLKQSDLAAKLHVTPQAISSWEKNRTQPKMEMIEDMCRIFNCKKSDFLEDSVSDHPDTVEINGQKYHHIGLTDKMPNDNAQIYEMSLTSEEARIITNYRVLSVDDKKTLLKMVHALRYSSEIKKLNSDL